MTYYIKIICDILDDDYVFHYIISFNSKDDAEIFKKMFDKIKFSFYVWIANIENIKNSWLRSYELNPKLERPIKISEQIDFSNILNLIINHINQLESLRFVNYMPYINDNILLKKEYMNIDEDELKLYMVANSGKQNLDNFIIILNEEEYDNIVSNTPIINNELIAKLTEPSYMLIYWHQVFSNKYNNCVLVNRYERITPYDKASNKLKLWDSIFYEDPLKFIQNENIIKDFSQELIKEMNDKINNEFEPIIFRNEYIYSQYTKYLKNLLNEEKEKKKYL